MQCNSAQNDQRFSNVHYSLNCFSVPLQAEGRRPAIRNSQFAIRNSQFAIRNSQFAIRNSQFPSVLAHFEAGSHENQEISFVGSWLPASSISKLSQPPSLPATRLAQPLLPRQFKFLENIACVGGGGWFNAPVYRFSPPISDHASSDHASPPICRRSPSRNAPPTLHRPLQDPSVFHRTFSRVLSF